MTFRNLIYLSFVPVLMLVVSGGLFFAVDAFEKSEETLARNIQTFSSTAGDLAKSAQPIETIRQLSSRLAAGDRTYLDAAAARNSLLISIATIVGVGAVFQIMLLVLVYRGSKPPNPSVNRDAPKAARPLP
jgi:hypothetical protein